MRQINLTNTQQHYNISQKKVLIGYVTHQFNKYTAKLQSVAHKSMYLETDQLVDFEYLAAVPHNNLQSV